MRLTSRDVQVLRAVHDYRVLRRDQIQNLLFPSRNTANYRLQRLYQHGFLERRWRPVEYGRGTGQAVYLLARRGVDLLAQSLTTDPRTARGAGPSNTVRSLFLDHVMAVNDVRIAVTVSAQGAGHRLEQWVREDELKATNGHAYATTASGAQRNVAIIPDAYFVLGLEGKRAHFLLEVDRATETNGRWAQRVRAYLAYIASGQYARCFGTTSLRILVITTSPERLANLKRATEQAGGGVVFWFTTLKRASPESALTQPIWKVAGREGMLALVAGGPEWAEKHGLPVLLREK